MRKLNLQDLAFLQMETDDCPAHVAGLQIFQLPESDDGAFVRDMMATFTSNNLPVTPPFNLRLHSDLLSLNVWPSWIEDDHFDLDFHVRYSALPAPGTMDQLMKLIQRLHARLLDRTRPLWECYFIEGLEGNRLAVYFKVHHACVDGVAAMAIMDRVLSRSPDKTKDRALWQVERQRRPQSEGDEPPAPSPMFDNIGAVFNQAKSVAELSNLLVKSSLGSLAGSKRAAPPPFTAPDTLFNRKITRHRRFAVRSFSLSRVKSIAKDLGVTLNDIVLALCSGALRHYLKDHDALPGKPLIASVPVSVRPKDAEQAGNQISMIATTLATDEKNPITRLRRINASSAEAKEKLSQLSPESAANYALVMNSSILISQALGIGEYVPQPSNLVVSNVPGPREDRYMMGAKLLHNYPLSVLIHGQALNITVLSYGDQLDFGLLAAREAMPDLDKLSAYLDRACDELEIADEHMLENQIDAARAKLAARRAIKVKKTAPAKSKPKASAKPKKAAAKPKKPATKKTAKKATAPTTPRKATAPTRSKLNGATRTGAASAPQKSATRKSSRRSKLDYGLISMGKPGE